MIWFKEFLSNSALWTAAIAWAIAQAIKIVLTLINEHRFDFTRITGTGGMPSSHSAFTVSLATSVGIIDGFTSTMFAIAAAFAIVVMYDATGIRRSAGQQAALLNKIVEKIGREDIAETGKKLKELLGHTPIQVFAGAVLGVAVSIVRYNYF